MIENWLRVTDEDGNETEMEIILTFDGYNGKQYVLVKNPDPESDDVYAFTYDEEGNLDPVEKEDEYQMCEEVLSAFEKDDNV